MMGQGYGVINDWRLGAATPVPKTVAIHPAGFTIRGRFWTEGTLLKCTAHAMLNGELVTVNAQVDLKDVMQLILQSPNSSAVIGGFPGSVVKFAKKVGKAVVNNKVTAAMKSVVKSKITGAIVGTAAVVFPPVGLPAAAAYAAANVGLAAIENANKVKDAALKLVKKSDPKSKALLDSTKSRILKTVADGTKARVAFRNIAAKARAGDPEAKKGAAIIAAVSEHRDRMQAIGIDAPIPGLLVTEYGKILPGRYLHQASQLAKISGITGQSDALVLIGAALPPVLRNPFAAPRTPVRSASSPLNLRKRAAMALPPPPRPPPAPAPPPRPLLKRDFQGALLKRPLAPTAPYPEPSLTGPRTPEDIRLRMVNANTRVPSNVTSIRDRLVRTNAGLQNVYANPSQPGPVPQVYPGPVATLPPSYGPQAPGPVPPYAPYPYQPPGMANGPQVQSGNPAPPSSEPFYENSEYQYDDAGPDADFNPEESGDMYSDDANQYAEPPADYDPGEYTGPDMYSEYA